MSEIFSQKTPRPRSKRPGMLFHACKIITPPGAFTSSITVVYSTSRTSADDTRYVHYLLPGMCLPSDNVQRVNRKKTTKKQKIKNDRVLMSTFDAILFLPACVYYNMLQFTHESAMSSIY